jgi:hypothetical protein
MRRAAEVADGDTMDIVVIAIALAFFLLSWAVVSLLDRL